MNPFLKNKIDINSDVFGCKSLSTTDTVYTWSDIFLWLLIVMILVIFIVFMVVLFNFICTFWTNFWKKSGNASTVRHLKSLGHMIALPSLITNIPYLTPTSTGSLTKINLKIGFWLKVSKNCTEFWRSSQKLTKFSE